MPELSDAQWEPIDAEIFADRMISAIKLYRMATGAGLKDAKDVVEARRESQLRVFPDRFGEQETEGAAPVEAPNIDWQTLDAEILAGRKISAIKLYREASGAGLKEAKDVIDAREKELCPPGEKFKAGAKTGCLSVLILVVGALIVYKALC